MITRHLNYILFFLVLVINIASQMKFGNEKALYILKFVVFVLHFIFMFIHIIKEKIHVPSRIRTIALLFYLWIFIMALSTFHLSSYAELASAYMMIASYLLLFLYSFIIFPNFLNHSKIKYISLAKAAYFAIMSAIGLAFVLGYGKPESTHFDPYSLRTRYMGFFQHPNTLGLYAFMGICLSYLVSQLSKNKLYLLSYPVLIYFIYSSSSRTALYATIIFIIATVVRKFSINLIRWTTNPLFLTFLIGFMLLSALMINWPGLFQAIDEGTSNRITVWTELLYHSDSFTKILFGQGAVRTDVSKDNYYVLVLINSGVVGLGVFLLIVFAVFKALLKYVQTDNLSKIMIIIYCIFALYSLVESVFFTLGNVFSVFLWVSVAIGISGSSFQAESIPVEKRKLQHNPSRVPL